jgi:peptide/nickel transport system substrate-binding protein
MSTTSPSRSHRRRSRWLTAAAATAALALTACNGPGSSTAESTSVAPTDGVLQLGLLNDIGQPPDPDVYYSGNGLAVTTNVYEGLVQYKPGTDIATIAPSLATAWDVSGDNTTYNFTLQKGVTFHDGTPFTSAAVASSFDRRAAVDAGPAYMVADVESVTAPDDYTVTIKLKEANSAFLDYLASPYGPKMLSPKAMAENAGDDNGQTYLSTHDAGTGPYTLTEAKVGERYELEAYDGYWGSKPTFTKVELPVFTDTSAMQLALDKGDLAAIIGAVPSPAQANYLKSTKVKSYSLPSFQVGVLYMNPNRPFLATSEARKAMFSSVDWKTVIDQVLAQKGELATGAYSRGAITDGSDTKEIKYDAALMATYAATVPESAKEVNVGHSAGSADDAQIANIIAAQLQTVGLKAKVTPYQSSQVFGSFASDPANAPDVYIASGTWPDANNPYMYGHVFWDKSGGLNHLQCADDQATALLDEAVRSGEQATYVAAAAKINEAYCTPTFAYVNDFVVAQPWLGQVEQSHSMAEPYTLDFNTLTVQK